MAKKQYFGINYPFTNDGFQNFFVDVNMTEKDKIRSQIMHVIFTPKGQRIRNPEFGTDLIKYIFEPSDSMSWSMVKNEITDAIEKFVPGASISNIRIVKGEEDAAEIFVRIDFSVKTGVNNVYNDSVIVQL